MFGVKVGFRIRLNKFQNGALCEDHTSTEEHGHLIVSTPSRKMIVHKQSFK